MWEHFLFVYELNKQEQHNLYTFGQTRASCFPQLPDFMLKAQTLYFAYRHEGRIDLLI